MTYTADVAKDHTFVRIAHDGNEIPHKITLYS